MKWTKPSNEFINFGTDEASDSEVFNNFKHHCKLTLTTDETLFMHKFFLEKSIYPTENDYNYFQDKFACLHSKTITMEHLKSWFACKRYLYLNLDEKTQFDFSEELSDLQTIRISEQFNARKNWRDSCREVLMASFKTKENPNKSELERLAQCLESYREGVSVERLRKWFACTRWRKNTDLVKSMVKAKVRSYYEKDKNAELIKPVCKIMKTASNLNGIEDQTPPPNPPKYHDYTEIIGTSTNIYAGYTIEFGPPIPPLINPRRLHV